MPDLDRAPTEVLDFVMRVAAEWRADLINAGVTFGCLVATPTEAEQGNAIPHLKFEKRHVPAFAEIVKGVGSLHRVPDLTLYLDDETWRASDHEERTAIVACALQRIALDVDEHGQAKLTKYNRPKLVEVRPDLVIVGYRANVGRFGEKAPEAQALKVASLEYRQRLMEWSDWSSDVAPQEDQRPASPFGVVA